MAVIQKHHGSGTNGSATKMMAWMITQLILNHSNLRQEGNTKDVEIAMPLKYLSNFWTYLEMPLINCKINLLLTWSENCDIINSASIEAFTITDRNLYLPVVTLSTQGNTKLLQQLRSGFKRIN